MATEKQEPLEVRWGRRTIQRGWAAVPRSLLESQDYLGLQGTDVVVLVHLIFFWRRANQLPFPSPKRIAQEMGIAEAEVENSLNRMESKNLLKRVVREDLPTAFDLNGLVEALDKRSEMVLARRNY